MSYLLGIDIGTSGVKAVLVSVEGKVINDRTETYDILAPKPGWVEQNPEDWWQSTRDVIKKILINSEIQAEDIKGISLSGQMHSSVFLDRDRNVIRPAILWSDTRTTEQCSEIYERSGGLRSLINYVSNPALEGFTAPKVLWLRENEQENFEKVSLVILPKDFIRYRLTGEINTEVSDAAGTLLFDVNKKSWSQGILDALNIDKQILPPVLNSIDVAGKITSTVAKQTGLKAGTPVVAGGADNACGAIGSGIIKEGRVMLSIGSSGVVLAQTDTPVADEKGRIHLFNHSQPNSWYMMGVMLSAGMSFSWLKEKMFKDILNYKELDNLAESVDPGSEGLLFLPYLYGERTPHADADARGVFFGISGNHEQKHFIRSVLEGVGYGLRDSLELIKDMGIEIEEVRAIGGGAKSKIWQQILADISGEQINILNIEEGPAFGAALIAGVGIGIYKNFEEVERDIIDIKEKIVPEYNNVAIYNKYYKLYKDLYKSLKYNYKNLNRIYQEL